MPQHRQLPNVLKPGTEAALEHSWEANDRKHANVRLTLVHLRREFGKVQFPLGPQRRCDRVRIERFNDLSTYVPRGVI